jgi:hypothetical protein
MSGRGFHFLPILCLLLISSGRSANAEPITLTLRARVSERCIADTCESFVASFPLIVAFDSGITQDFVSDDLAERRFGPPRFSDIPLAIPPISSDAVQSSAVTAHGWARVEGGFRVVSVFEELVSDVETNSLRHTLVRATAAFDTPPSLTPESFVALLSRDAASFVYALSVLRDDAGPSPTEVAYLGEVFVDGSGSPIPEPGTSLLLSAAGLAGLLRRQGQHRRAAQLSEHYPT